MAFLIFLLLFSSVFAERAYVTSGSGVVSVVNSEEGTELPSISLPGCITTEVVASPDGSTLYVVDEASATILFIDAYSGKVMLKSAVGYNPVSLARSPDGARLFALSQVESAVYVIDAWTGNRLAVVPVADYPNVIVVDPSGSFAYVSSNGRSFEGVITEIDLATYKPSTFFQTAHFRPRGLAVSPDGCLLYVADALKDESSSNGAIYIINTFTLNSLKVLIPEIESATELAISPAGDKLFISEFGSAEFVMDLGTKSVERILGAGGGYRFAFSLNDYFLFGTAFLGGGRVYLVATSTNEFTTVFLLDNPSYGIAVAPNPPDKPAPPSHLTGSCRTDRFINFSTSLKTLSWTASPSLNVTAYRIYREGLLIATLPTTQLQFSFKEKSKAKLSYEVSSVDFAGRESSRLRISL